MLYTAYTVDTVDIAYTFDTVDTVYTVYTVVMVYTVDMVTLCMNTLSYFDGLGHQENIAHDGKESL